MEIHTNQLVKEKKKIKKGRKVVDVHLPRNILHTLTMKTAKPVTGPLSSIAVVAMTISYGVLYLFSVAVISVKVTAAQHLLTPNPT